MIGTRDALRKVIESSWEDQDPDKGNREQSLVYRSDLAVFEDGNSNRKGCDQDKKKINGPYDLYTIQRNRLLHEYPSSISRLYNNEPAEKPFSYGVFLDFLRAMRRATLQHCPL